MLTIRSIAVALILPLCACTALSQPPTSTQTPAPSPAPAPATDEIKTGDDLLKALETADANLHTLTADVIYSKTFGLAGDRQTRVGKLSFEDARKAAKPDQGAPPSLRKFSVIFDQLIVGKRLEEVQKMYIFDGRFVVEKIPAEKKMTKSELVREGDNKDPLKIGEGPMPIPIGQKRDDILARFNVELVPAEDGVIDEDEAEEAQLKKHIAGTYQIKLIPKPGQKETAFDEIRLWYRRGTAANGDPQLLPRMARTVIRRNEAVEDVEVVRLVNVKTNVDLPAGTFDTSPPPGWDVTIH